MPPQSLHRGLAENGVATRLRRRRPNRRIRRLQKLLNHHSRRSSPDQREVPHITRSIHLRLRQQHFLLRRQRQILVPQSSRPGNRIIVAWRMIGARTQVLKLAKNDVVSLRCRSLISIANRRQVIRKIPQAQHHIELWRRLHRINRIFQFRRHPPPAPAIADPRRYQVRMQHCELSRNLAALPLAIHVDSTWIHGVRLHRPLQQLLQRRIVGSAEFLRLRMPGNQHILVTQPQPL